MSDTSRSSREASAVLWQRILAVFEAHRQPTDSDAQAALNRIAMKCLGLDKPSAFDPDTCTVSLEILEPSDLRSLKTFHRRDRPAREVEPIVVLESDGKRYVVDGNNRVNKWSAQHENVSRSAIVLKLRAA